MTHGNGRRDNEGEKTKKRGPRNVSGNEEEARTRRVDRRKKTSRKRAQVKIATKRAKGEF